MTKEHHQLDIDIDAKIPDIGVHPSDYDTTQADVLCTVVKVEIGPLFTTVSINGHSYCLDHVTGRLLER